MCISVQLESGHGKDLRQIWLALPATKKQFETAAEKLNSDCCGVAISRYSYKVPGSYKALYNESSLAKINHLASRLKKLDNQQIIKMCAIGESNLHFKSIDEMLEFTYDTEMFILVPDIFNEEDLGRHELNKPAYNQFADSIKEYFEPHTFGRKIAETGKGEFTSFGYLVQSPAYSGDKTKHRIPPSLDLKGRFGEDLYAELDYIPETFGNSGVICT